MKTLMILFFFLFTRNNLKAKTIYVSKRHNLTKRQQGIVLMDFQALNEMKNNKKMEFLPFVINLCRLDKNKLKGDDLKKILKILQSMIDAGADVNATTFSCWTALHFACEKGHKEIAELLLKAGADVNAKASSYTALHFACRGGHKEIAELLIIAGADLNAKASCASYTALHFACEKGHKEIAELLINAGADVNLKNKEGQTPLELCYEIGVKENKTLLLSEDSFKKF